MSGVIQLERYLKQRFVPPLVFVEMHQHQLIYSPMFDADHLRQVLGNLRALLDRARFETWPVAFVAAFRRLQRRPRTGLAWIEGFEPRRSDMVFEPTEDSCYSSEEFAAAITSAGSHFVLAGFSFERACLSTLIDTPRHGHHAGFVVDASVAGPLTGYSAVESQRAVAAIASRYATVLTTSCWLKAADRSQYTLEASDDITSHR
jgi:nicotinamidase-related amidase